MSSLKEASFTVKSLFRSSSWMLSKSSKFDLELRRRGGNSISSFLWEEVKDWERALEIVERIVEEVREGFGGEYGEMFGGRGVKG